MAVVTNLVPNPRAGVDLAGTVESNPAGTAVCSRNATEGPNGTTAFKVAVIPPNTATAGFSIPLTLQAGQYAFQIKVKTDSACNDGAVVIRRADTFEVLWQNHSGVNTPWTQRDASFNILTPLSVEILIGTSFYGSGNGAAGTVWFSELGLFKNPSGTIPYFDGSTPSSGTNAYAWTGTPHNSTSTWDNAFAGAAPVSSDWVEVFNDEFTSVCAEGAFITTYGTGSARANKWSAYPSDYLTTYGQAAATGDHYDQNNISVVSGVTGATGNAMKMRLYRDGAGKCVGAGPEPLFNNGTPAQLYGRYEVRFKADTAVAGWNTAWLLWPTSEIWPRDGEIDFPEGGINGTMSAFMHRQDGTSGADQDVYPTTTTYADWHTAIIEWSPNRCVFILDGVTIGTSTSRVPNTPMRYALQTENNNGPTQPPAGAAATANVYVDYVKVFDYAPTGTPTPGPGTAVAGWYPYGVAPNLPQATRQSHARAIYDAFVTYTFTQTGMAAGMPAGAWRVKVPDQFTDGNSPPGNNHSFSEGIAFGMLATAVYSNPALPTGIYDPTAHAKFDGLYKYWKFYDRISGDEVTPRGFMDWRIDANGNITGAGGATDGDHDAAMALLLMHRTHGSGSSGSSTPAFNYGAEATKLINAIRDWEITPANFNPANVMTNGDHWGFSTDRYMADYFAPAWYREFQKHTGDARWATIINVNYPIARGIFDQRHTTGMVPDESNRAGNATGSSSYIWGYNAIRSPWRSVLDYLWNGPGAPAVAKGQADKLAAFGKAQRGPGVYPGGLKAEYTLNGTFQGNYHNLAYAQAFAAAATASAENSQFAADAMTFLYNQRTEASYFGTGLATMTSMFMAGLMQPNAAPVIVQPTPTPPPPTGTPTSTGLYASPTLTSTKRSQIESVYTGIKNQYIRPDGGVMQLEGDNKITSEGQAYAAMMAVQFGDKPTFDLVESFSIGRLERRNWKPGGADNWRTGGANDPRTLGPDLMAWNFSNPGNAVTDWNYATDADVDRAKALIWGYYRGWGQGYLTKALAILGQLADKNLHLYSGKRYLSTDEFQTDGRNPVEINISYLDPAGFKLFHKVTGDERWNLADDGFYDMYDKTARTNTGPLATTKGLPPDWNGFNIATGAVDRIGSRLIKYSYDAFRTHNRMYWDWLFYRDARSPQRLVEFKNFITSEWQQFGRFGMEYEHDGTPIGGRYEKTMEYWTAYFALTANDPANAIAASIKSTKLDNRYSVAGNGGFWQDGPDNNNRSYFADYWVQMSEMTAAGVWVDWGNSAATPINAQAIAFTDTGTSADAVGLKVTQRLAITDTGTSIDRANLTVPVILRIDDTGTSVDSANLTVAGSAPIVQLQITDRGGSADSVAFFQTRANLRIFDFGTSTDSVELAPPLDRSIRPDVGLLANEIYEALGSAFTSEDDRNEWQLLRFVNAIAKTPQETDDLVRDTDDYVGWSSIMDLDRVADNGIGYLAQFIGVDTIGDLTPEAQRLRVKETAGFQRGTKAAIEGAAKQYLTGSRLVRVYERDTSPYHFRVVLFGAEVPEPDRTRRAILDQKPAGLVAVIDISTGQSYAELTSTNKTYLQLSSTYPTYADMKLSVPA